MPIRFHAEGILEGLVTGGTDALRQYSCVTVLDPIPETCTRLQLRSDDKTSLVTVYARVPDHYLGKRLKYEEWHHYRGDIESLEQRISTDEHPCIYATLQLENSQGPILRQRYCLARRVVQRVADRIRKLFW